MREPVRGYHRWRVFDPENIDWPNDPLAENRDWEPQDSDHPLVYHLFGHVSIRWSVALTEDDFFKFLIGADSDKRADTVFPSYVGRVLDRHTLLFVGFSVHDWEFRVLMHGLVANLDQRLGFKHVAVQLEFTGVNDTEAVRDFMEKYFQDARISLFLGDNAQFIAELRERWEAGY